MPSYEGRRKLEEENWKEKTGRRKLEGENWKEKTAQSIVS